MKNRILAVLLALALCLALLPTSVFAVEDTSADASSVTSSAAENDEPSVEAEEPVSDTGADASAPADLETPEETADEPEASEPVADTPEEPAAPEAPASSEEPAETDVAEPTEEDEIMALAEGDPEEENTSVAKIGDTEYATLDEAVAAAADGGTIELLADATTKGLNLSKDLTIRAAEGAGTPTITFTQHGIALWGKALTFKNVNVVMTGIGSTPYTAEWNWMTVCASQNASLSLDNATMTLDGANAGNKHAIYFCSNNKLNLTNGSTLTIRNYQQDALEWDGGDGGYNVNITDSTFISDHNRSGFTGTFYATITNSTVNVINSTGNGSNGSHFIIMDSTVNFNDNGSHGLSAGILSVTNSTIDAKNNGLTGIIFTSKGTFVNSTITITGTAGKSYWNAGMRLYKNNASATIDKDTTLTISDNLVTGLFMDASTSLTIEEGAKVLITRNHAEQAHCATKLDLAQSGGGIVVRNGARAILSSSTEIYNNHAKLCGDDIYIEENGSITFSKVGNNWILDDCDDVKECSGAIDGWYYDGQEQDARWNAHDPYYIRQYQDFDENGMATITGQTALKAAHGIDPVTVPELPDPEWTISRSKTATNLDGNYESQVTLSLPSAEEQLVSDVVFVLDKSTSADLEQQALAMLRELQEQLEGTGAKINVGVVIFNKVANSFGFYDLATQYSDIETAITTTISSGTNSHAGLLAGMDMLAADTDTDDSRKYLIFVSDGITYMYNEAPTVTAWTFKADTVLNWAGPDNWNSKYGTNAAPDDWSDYLATVGAMVEAQGTTYEYPYGGTATTSTPLGGQSTYANSVDKALYLTYQAYQAAAGKYHCYAMTANQNKGTQYAWGPSFMNYLANGEDVSFEQIQNDIVYLVDAGSTVEDYMGYVADDYNFDFVNEASAMTLTVGDTSYDAVRIADNQYGFKPVGDGYAYTVTYEAGNLEDTEHFVWAINEAITNFAPVQLTYTVKLTNPKAEVGTYGTYDADGSQGYEGLYTNNSAILYPVDTTGSEGEPQEFAKPTVSYTVKETPTEPTQPTEPTEPTQPTEPTEPTKPTEPTQPAQPTQPGGPTQTSTQTPQKTETTTPKTGDSSNLALPIGLAAVCAVALGVLIPLSRKRGYSGKREK